MHRLTERWLQWRRWRNVWTANQARLPIALTVTTLPPCTPAISPPTHPPCWTHLTEFPSGGDYCPHAKFVNHTFKHTHLTKIKVKIKNNDPADCLQGSKWCAYSLPDGTYVYSDGLGSDGLSLSHVWFSERVKPSCNIDTPLIIPPWTGTRAKCTDWTSGGYHGRDDANPLGISVGGGFGHNRCLQVELQPVISQTELVYLQLSANSLELCLHASMQQKLCNSASDSLIFLPRCKVGAGDASKRMKNRDMPGLLP